MTEETAAVGDSAEELTEKSRLKSLFTARDEAAQAIRNATMQEYQLRNNGNAKSAELVDEHVRSAVAAYVLECEPLFQNTQTGQNYWKGYEFAPVPLPSNPPESIVNDNIGPNIRQKEIVGVPDGMISDDKQRLFVTGIGSYVSLPCPIKVRWTGYSDSSLWDTQNDAVAVTTTGVPRTLSESVFRATNNLLADLDIGLDAEQQSDSEASYDYSDLL